MTRFDWDEYLELAEEWVGRRGHPAAERSAISRAYYAAFHKAKAYYLAQGERLGFDADDHRAIAVWLQSNQNPAIRVIGVNPQRLRQLRREADYDDVFENLSAEARAGVLTARRIVAAIAALI